MSAKRSVAAGPGGKLICPWLHTEVCCDGCHASPISGYRYQCQARRNFDLCSSCFRRESPDAQRHFIRIERCQASKPYQIFYVECHDCGVAPIKGPRYKHKTQAETDLCELCFERAVSFRKAVESDFERLEETKVRSKGKKYHPALNFDKTCDECQAYPIIGPCYVSIKNPNYDLCAHCHDHVLMLGKATDGDFLVPSAKFHLDVISCFYCGDFPMYGPRYNNGRKNVCLLCYFHIKEEKKCHFTKVEPPTVVTKSSSISSQSPAYSSPHIQRSASAPSSTHPQQYGPGNVPCTQPSSATGPPARRPPDARYQHSNSYSAAVHPSQYLQPKSYPATEFPPARQHPGNFVHPAAPGVPNSKRFNVNPLTQVQQKMVLFRKYYNTLTAQKQQQIIAFIRARQRANQGLQNQQSQQFSQNLADGNGGGGDGGGGGGVDYSSQMGGDDGSAAYYSSQMGGNDGSGVVDYSSFTGSSSGSGVDCSSLIGGNPGGGDFDFSSFLGGGGLDPSTFTQGTGLDPSTFVQGAGMDPTTFVQGAGFDPSTFVQGAGFDPSTFVQGTGFDPSTFLQGGDAIGAIGTLLGALGGLGS